MVLGVRETVSLGCIVNIWKQLLFKEQRDSLSLNPFKWKAISWLFQAIRLLWAILISQFLLILE